MTSIALLGAVACIPTTTLEPEADLQVALIAPAAGEPVRQNDPTIGCPGHEFRGYGFELKLQWEEAVHPSGIASYDIWVQHLGARHPIVNASTDRPGLSERSCNGFVADPNLDHWQWRVRAVSVDGEVGPWSEGEFSFEPCRLESGAACWAPPEP